MKKLLTLLVVLSIVLAGCGVSKPVQKTAPQESGRDQVQNTTPDSAGSQVQTPPPGGGKGIVWNSYKFENVDVEKAPKSILDIYEKSKTELKVTVKDDDKYTYIIATMGEKPTAGYSIKVTSIDDNENGKLCVTLKTGEPEKGVLAAQVISYPVDIVRIPKTNLPFYAVDSNGNKVNTEVVK